MGARRGHSPRAAEASYGLDFHTLAAAQLANDAQRLARHELKVDRGDDRASGLPEPAEFH